MDFRCALGFFTAISIHDLASQWTTDLQDVMKDKELDDAWACGIITSIFFRFRSHALSFSLSTFVYWFLSRAFTHSLSLSPSPRLLRVPEGGECDGSDSSGLGAFGRDVPARL